MPLSQLLPRMIPPLLELVRWTTLPVDVLNVDVDVVHEHGRHADHDNGRPYSRHDQHGGGQSMLIRSVWRVCVQNRS